jgi:hypothetical protein
MIEVDQVTPPRVSVTMGFTRNMGNFESLRIDVGVEASANKGEKVAEAFDRVYSFVETKLVEKFQETENELKGRGLGQGAD